MRNITINVANPAWKENYYEDGECDPFIDVTVSYEVDLDDIFVMDTGIDEKGNKIELNDHSYRKALAAAEEQERNG